MPEHRRQFSPQFKAEAVQMVIETGKPIAEVAPDLGVLDGTLGNWVNARRREHPEPDQPLSPVKRARVKELEDENRRLRMENELVWSQLWSHSPPSGTVHRRPRAAYQRRSRTVAAVVNIGQHCWKACWGQPLASSNLASSATLTCGDALQPGSLSALRPELCLISCLSWNLGYILIPDKPVWRHY